jgi:1-acyl-sn-glycerol-3-phosphate acyltransferase
MKALGWRFAGERPKDPKFILLGAPHTSNWDFLLTLALMAHFDLPLRYMVKDSVFKGPWGGFFRSLGAIPIDRSKKYNRVEATIEAFRTQEKMVLGILPEGTRKRTEFWKSGFYHIAHGAGVPLVLAKVDGPNKTLTLGLRLETSGDIEADMAKIAAYYEGAQGIYPEKFGPVRLRPGDS